MARTLLAALVVVVFAAIAASATFVDAPSGSVAAALSALRDVPFHDATAFRKWLCSPIAGMSASSISSISSTCPEAHDTPRQIVGKALRRLAASGVPALSPHATLAALDAFVADAAAKLDQGMLAKLRAESNNAAATTASATRKNAQVFESSKNSQADISNAKKINNEKKTKTVGDVSGVLPYYRFIPKYLGTARPGGSVSFTTECFATCTSTVAPAPVTIPGAGNVIAVTTTFADQTSSDCVARLVYIVAALNKVPSEVLFPGTHTAYLNVTEFSPSEMWVLNNDGVSIHAYNDTKFEQISDLLQTALLFAPGGSDIITAMNILFFNDASRIQPPIRPRKHPTVTPLNYSAHLRSGDVLLVSGGLDGLGSTISFPAGTTASHSAIVLEDIRTGKGLMVCESTDPEIKCSPLAPWIAAHDGVIWLPLDRSSLSAKFDVAAAWAKVDSLLGYRYGYNNFIFGWIDTANKNYPCFPPDFKRCMTWQHLQWFAFFLEKASPSHANEYYLQAIYNRLGEHCGNLAQCLEVASKKKGWNFADLVTGIEQDTYVYNTTRYGKPAQGPAMVCSTFACSILRAGGALNTINGTLNCAEQSPWNLGAFQIYDQKLMGANRPAICVARDPSNPLCQLSGRYTFHAGTAFNEMPLRPWMGQTCATQNPGYHYDPTC